MCAQPAVHYVHFTERTVMPIHLSTEQMIAKIAVEATWRWRLHVLVAFIPKLGTDYYKEHDASNQKICKVTIKRSHQQNILRTR